MKRLRQMLRRIRTQPAILYGAMAGMVGLLRLSLSALFIQMRMAGKIGGDPVKLMLCFINALLRVYGNYLII